MAKGAPTLGGVDIEAIQQAVELLTDAEFQVMDIERANRQESDEHRVRWTMTVETDARTTSLGDFDD